MHKVINSFPEKLITLEEAKSFLKIVHNEDDEFIKNCINTALNTAESFLQCYLCAKSIEFVTEVTEQEIKMPITPIRRVGRITNISITDDIKDLCQIGIEKTTIILPDEVKGKTIFLYQNENSPLSPSLKHGIMSHMEIIYEKRLLSQEELNQILNFYKPHRRILV